jgi:hypothetical protein
MQLNIFCCIIIAKELPFFVLQKKLTGYNPNFFKAFIALPLPYIAARLRFS